MKQALKSYINIRLEGLEQEERGDRARLIKADDPDQKRIARIDLCHTQRLIRELRHIRDNYLMEDK